MVKSNQVNFQEITEGATAFFVPTQASDTTEPITEHKAGPMARTEPVFYNPAMKGTRDVAVLFERAVAEDNWKILDGLGASGAKGLRLYEEGKHDCQIVINDHSPKAFDLIQKNISQWDREDRITAVKRGLHGLLPEKKYDWVDIDPFGSPVDFLDGAVRAVRNRGILSITATDTAPLCGTYPTTCIRRYGARPLHTGCMHEIGIRILIGNAIKRAAVFDLAATPILSYFSGHCFRAYFRIKRGGKPADALVKQVGFVVKEKNGGYAEATWPNKGQIHGGPLWLGELSDTTLIKNMISMTNMIKEAEKETDASISKDTIKLLEILAEEIQLPAYNYTTDEIAKACKVHPPNTKQFVQLLKENGFQASILHYDTKSVKTDAKWKDISKIAKGF
ncbi:MAG: hypothetical protein KAS67_03625 [Thermoplasmata archaeon]|nr:hypothetical protein [Thermoplasmata archaeon]